LGEGPRRLMQLSPITARNVHAHSSLIINQFIVSRCIVDRKTYR
jgi:hypothetical protein